MVYLLIAWWIFPWQTVNVITRLGIFNFRNIIILWNKKNMGISLDFRVETFTKSEMSEKQSPEWHPKSQTPRIQAGSSVSHLGVDSVLILIAG
jgi:hypothetical protein